MKSNELYEWMSYEYLKETKKESRERKRMTGRKYRREFF